MSTWRLDDIPDLSGRTAVVTGVTSGLGTVTARELARAGARVVLAARNSDKLRTTRAALEDAVGSARFESLQVDLADLDAIRAAAKVAADLGPIDLLINNAGVMAPPYQRTRDGLELQLATNHFGPFLLTGLLLDQLAASGDARIVSVASVMHRLARSAPLSDPRDASRRYSAWGSYAQSKLANLLFTSEADRRLRDRGLPVRAYAAHPGYAATELMANGPGQRLARNAAASVLGGVFQSLGQSAEQGALPTLMAATADLPPGTYCGPDGPAQMRGAPQVVRRTSGLHLQHQVQATGSAATRPRHARCGS